MKDDMISRQAALDALRTCYDTNLIVLDNGDELIHYGDAVGAIEALPSAQPGWIPVTDRLPDKSGLYLVTEHTAYGVEVHSRYWNLRPDGSFWSGWHGDEVLAWQPLPTPYREGGQS